MKKELRGNSGRDLLFSKTDGFFSEMQKKLKIMDARTVFGIVTGILRKYFYNLIKDYVISAADFFRLFFTSIRS